MFSSLPVCILYTPTILWWSHFITALRILVYLYSFARYAYSSEDAGEEFDKDDTLKLIKPSSPVSKDVTRLEARSAMSGNGLTNTGLEEEKTA